MLVENFGLCEFEHSGPSFTYSNKSSPPVLSRLDQYLANAEWFELFPGMIKTPLNYYESDHRVLIL